MSSVTDTYVLLRAFVDELARCLPDARLRIVAGGHGLPLENPAAIADALHAL